MVYIFLLIALVLVSPHSVFKFINKVNQIKSNYELERQIFKTTVAAGKTHFWEYCCIVNQHHRPQMSNSSINSNSNDTLYTYMFSETAVAFVIE